jgi:hypothetical protein
MAITSKVLYEALYRIGSEGAALLSVEVIHTLVQYRMLELVENGDPQMTPCGQECYWEIKAGNGRVAEFDKYATDQ